MMNPLARKRLHVAFLAGLALAASPQSLRSQDAGKPLDDPANPELVKSGGKLFLTQCVACHALTLPAGLPQNLKDDKWLHGSKPDEIAAAIADGAPAKAMPAFGKTLKPAQIQSLVAYILSLQQPAKP
jgi:mono/diheme cytochrome c family protein